jgi:hypothetical protein
MTAISVHTTLFRSDVLDAFTLGNLARQDPWTAHSGTGTSFVHVIAAPAGLSGNSVRWTQPASTPRKDVKKPLGVSMSAGQKRYGGFDVMVTRPTT